MMLTEIVSSESVKSSSCPSTCSKSNARPTPKPSVAVACSRSSPMREWVCTAVLDGRLLVTRLVHLLYAFNAPPRRKTNANNGQLFGGSAFAKEYIFSLQDYNAASWSQNFVASIFGASASLIVSAPLDVIKTRIQNRNFENPESGTRIIANMIKNEGPGAFFKGLVPKLLMTGPKLVFSFWLAQTLIPAFGKVI